METTAVKTAHAPKSTGSIDTLATVWADIERIQKTLSGCVLNERPSDTFTIAEYAAKYNCSYSTARDRLKQLIRIGKVEVLKVRLPDNVGRLSVHNVYRVIEKS